MRPKRTEFDLQRASNHLHYEIWMFVSLANGMATGMIGEGPLSNAVLEAFTIHARILLDFLYAEKPQQDDVAAEDFFPDPSIWASERPVKSELLSRVHGRVAKEVAHLTYVRLDVTPETKPWYFLQLAEEVDAAFAKFLSIVPLRLLGSKWEDIKGQRAGETA